MRVASSQRGYALLAALVVTALAVVFAAAAVAAVSARQSIVVADVANVRAQAATRQALARVCLELRRHPAALQGELSSLGVSAADATWRASWVAADQGAGVSWPTVAVRIEGSYGAARRTLSAVLQLRAEAVPQGLSVGADNVKCQDRIPLVYEENNQYLIFTSKYNIFTHMFNDYLILWQRRH